MDLLDQIKARRTVRKYKKDPIPEGDLQKVLEAARWAPSWANFQCWEYVVVKGPLIKTKLAECFGKGNPIIPALTEAPVVLVACGQLQKSGYFKGKAATDKGDWFMFGVGLSMENVILAAHSLGLGTAIVGAFDAKKVAETLGLPENVAVVAITPLGYPQQIPSAPPRKEIAEFVHYDKFGQRGGAFG
jgi:nitroreductase